MVTALVDDYGTLKTLTDSVTWTSGDTSIATVRPVGFVLPTVATRYQTDSGSYEKWRATGLLGIHGVSEGTTTVTGRTAKGTAVTCKVTVSCA